MQTTKNVNTICASKEYISYMNTEALQKAQEQKNSAEQAVAQKWKKDKMAKTEEIIKKCNAVCDKIYADIDSAEWVSVKNETVYYNKKNNMVVPNPNKFKLYTLKKRDIDSNSEIIKMNNINLDFYGLKGSLPTEDQLKYILKTNTIVTTYFDNLTKKDRKSGKVLYILILNKGAIQLFDYNKSYLCSEEDSVEIMAWEIDWCRCVAFPICTLDSKKTYVELLSEHSFVPDTFNMEEKKYFSITQKLYQNGYVTIDKGVKLTKTGKEYFENDGLKEMFGVTIKKNIVEFKKPEPIEKKLKSGTISVTAQDKSFLLKDYIDCDKIRADMESYDLKRFEDPNMGHWELWAEPKGKWKVNTNIPFVARNPLADVKNNCIVGIDFGTKSTIVVYQDGNDNTQPMRIGVGKLNKAADLKDFENPTIMEFINFENFIKDYKAEKGRPHTKWNDLTISYTAANSLTNVSVKSDEFYSFFYDLKQWAGDNKRQVKIKDKSGHEKLLYAYADLTKEDFDPIEIYAYYIGLYINNMNNGIYLNYLLSFPVTYEKKIREKLLKSFEKGIKKSLPQEVLNDEKCMKSFRLKQGASEPEAYAICALQQYGFEPFDNEEVVYAIFDFGGGTTDFDFGIWKAATEQEDIYDYEINHFGSGGDKYLGGENLLELLAYNVFCDNIEECRKQKIVFCKPEECVAPEDIKYFISQSQEAKMNTKHLEEASTKWRS